jgi:hypothetical protein
LGEWETAVVEGIIFEPEDKPIFILQQLPFSQASCVVASCLDDKIVPRFREKIRIDAGVHKQRLSCPGSKS